MVLGGVLLGSSLSGSRESKASDEAQNCKYYTSVRIEEGDSLWDIAEEYMTEEYENKTANMECDILMNTPYIREKNLGEKKYVSISICNYYEYIPCSIYDTADEVYGEAS